MINGFLDRADWDFVVGWIADDDRVGTRLQIVIEVKGETRWEGPADVYRRDLEELGIGDGYHGFAVALEHLGELPEEDFEINVRVKGGDAPMAGSPRMVPGVKRQVPLPSLTDRAADITGNLDDVNGTIIRGWAFDRNRPDVPVSVDLFIDACFQNRVNADQFRQDLKDANLGQGKCAFYFPTPIILLDGKSHTVQVISTNLNDELSNSPQNVKILDSTPVHHFASMQNKFNLMLEEFRGKSQSFESQISQVINAAKDANLYREWYSKNVYLSQERRTGILKLISKMKKIPTISIVMPVYNTEPLMLRSAIDSVRSQLYPHWELCISDDNSTSSQTKQVLDEYSKIDSRIKITYRKINGRISDATNTGLNMARGQYVAFLDHDDELTEDALFRMVSVINQTNADLLYSDEDKIDTRGSLFDPHFKPAFNYTLLLSHNYICHFVVVKRELALKIGEFRTATNGSQDYDFLLRLSCLIPHEKIIHVPHILYHWRAHAASTALDVSVKSYVLDAGITALKDHLSDVGVIGATIVAAGSHYEITWPLEGEEPLVSVIIPTRDCADILAQCLVGLLERTNYKNVEVIIVNNGSVEEATQLLFHEVKKDLRVTIVDYNKEFNYSAICNFGVTFAKGEILLMLNNDVVTSDDYKDWLTHMVAHLRRPGVGAVGAKLLFPNSKVQHGGVIIGVGGVAGHAHKFLDEKDYGYFTRLQIAQELSACTAACLLFAKKTFEQISGFDKVNLPVSFNDVDLCLRIRELGLAVVYVPQATLIHHESYSRGPEISPAKILRSQKEVGFMKKRWSHILEQDPAYSPSLTLKHEDFSWGLDRDLATGTIWRTSALGNQFVIDDSY